MCFDRASDLRPMLLEISLKASAMAAVRSIARCVVLGCVVLIGAGPGKAPQVKVMPAGENASVRLPPEVRLRKLHLVRPDLIPYPIAYEVCC